MAKINKVEIVADAGAQPMFDDVKRVYDDNLHPSKLDMTDDHVYKHVYHDGRWAGIFQCIEGGTPVTMSDLTEKRMDHVSVGDRVMCYDDERRRFDVDDVIAVMDNGMRECVELCFDTGNVLCCTPDHQIKTRNRGWVQACDLNESDDIVGVR